MLCIVLYTSQQLCRDLASLGTGIGLSMRNNFHIRISQLVCCFFFSFLYDSTTSYPNVMMCQWWLALQKRTLHDGMNMLVSS